MSNPISKIHEMRELESQIAEMNSRVDALRPSVAPQIEMIAKIIKVCDERGISRRDMALELCPELAQGVRTATASTGIKTRRARTMKVYLNPHDNTVVETKGGNNKTLRAWKEQYGGDVVESWLQNDSAAA